MKNIESRFVFLLVTLVTLMGVVPSLSWAIVVTNTNNSGPGSLRQAILDARNDPAANVITFDAAILPAIITPATLLPALNAPGDTIDGGGAGSVILDGVNVKVDNNGNPCSETEPQCHGIRIFASDITIQGLTVQNFIGDGVRVQPDPTTPSGQSDQTLTGIVISEIVSLAHAGDGIVVSGGSDNNTLEVVIMNTKVSSKNSGIRVSGSNTTGTGGNTIEVTISGNTSEKNAGRLSPLSGDGIVIVGGGGLGVTGNNIIEALIFDNTLLNNAGEGLRVAGAGTGSSSSNNRIDVSITNNKIQLSGQRSSGSGNGITITGGPTPEIPADTSGNTVTFVVDGKNVSVGNRGNGIGVQGGNGSNHVVSGTIFDNTFSNNRVSGIFLTGRGGSSNTLQNIEIQANTSKNNALRGLEIFGGDSVNTDNASITNVLIENNTFNANKRQGILASLGSGVGNVISFAGIMDNGMIDNLRHGLLVEAGVDGNGATPISGNSANKNKRDGIGVEAIGYFLSQNRANSNTNAGISAFGNSHDSSNTAKGNSTCNTPGCF